MSPTQMRLRLVVRRNCLPDANIVWPISLENDPTIARLVEQVSEIVPLESADWGLEDYAVELHAADGSKFECLHFQPIRSVLKEDDHVFIRPLASEDIKQRRFNGRHQISADGKHLVDGVAFGRPLLRAPRGRPPLDIPPRKRRRIGYEDEDNDELPEEEDEDWAPRFLTNGEEGNQNPKSVRFATDFDGVETDDDEDDDEEAAQGDGDRDLRRGNFGGGETSVDDPEQDNSDDDEDLDENLDEDLEDELEDLRKDNADVQGSQTGQDEPMDEAPTSAQEPDLQPLRNVEILQAAFPSAPAAVCEQILLAGNHDLNYSYATLLAAFKPEMPESKLSRSWKPADFGNDPIDVASGRTDNNDDLDDEEEEAEDDEEGEVTDFVKQYDHRGLPPGSISAGARSSTKFDDQSDSALAPLTRSKKSLDNPAPIDDDDTSSSGTSSASSSDEDEDDAEADSSSEEDSSSDDDAVVKKPRRGRDASDSSDEDSESHDSSDSGPEETTSKGGANVGPSRKRHQKSYNVSDSSSSCTSSSDGESDADNETSSSEESSDEDSDSTSSGSSSESEEEVTSKVGRKTKPPAASTSNSRHSASAKEASQRSGSTQQPQPLVPPGAGKDSTKKRNERRRLLEKMRKSGQEIQKPGASTDASQPTEKELFEAKRKALLDAIASGGVEVGPKGDFNFADESTTSQRSTKRKRNEQNASQPLVEAGVQAVNGGPDKETAAPESTEAPASQENGSPNSAQKRRRIDLGAGRRMLFGALGLRNPKTREDEDKLRAKLMKDVRPLANARLAEATAETPAAEEGEVEEEDPDAWREKITYRAVECCQEGIELSEPPFPFVQRWDPQQQGHWYHKKNKRGGNNKKAQRNQSQFYEEDTGGGKKRKHNQQEDWENEGYDDPYYDESQAMELNYDDVEEEVTGNDQTAEASQFTDVDDLPSLPNNLADLAPLTPGEVKKDMVITWKQFILSKATNWQPQVNDLTGVVVRIDDDDATSLQVLLARRDRHLDRTEKQYDENTGQRIYERFEAPVDEDADEEALEEQGYRTLAFADMMEPKILQEPLTQDEPSGEPQVPSIEDDVEAEQASEELNATPQDKLSGVTKAPSVDGIEESEAMEADEAIKDSQANQTLGFDETFEGFEDGASNEQSTPVQPPTDEVPVPDEHTPNNQIPAPALGAPEVSDGQPGPGPTSAEVSMSDISQISSPSRQLRHETTHQSIDSALMQPTGPEPPLGDSQLATDDPQPSPAPPDFSAESESPTTPQRAVSVVTTALDAASDGLSIYERESIEPDCALTQAESSAPSHFNETTNIMTGTPRVTYPKVAAPPSSPGSLLSGRQPDISLDIDPLEPESLRGTTEDEADHGGWSLGEEPSMPMEEDDTPTKLASVAESEIKKSPQTKPESAKDNDSPSSLSLNTVWCTVASSRNTLSPSRGRGKSIPLHRTQQSQAFKAGDQEYQEAMRRLDNLAGEDESDANNLIPSEQSRIDTRSSLSVKDEGNSSPGGDNLSALRFRPQATLDISPPPLSRKRLPKPPRPSQSSIPAGSQISETSSDSDEPGFTENYADEDVDATYSPATESSLHLDGPGWVQKTKKKQWMTRSSTAPLDPGSQDDTKGNKPAVPGSSSQMAGGRKSMESAVSVFKRWNKGRKTSARF